MIPINKENLGAFLIACGIGLGLWFLIWLAGCDKPAGAENLPTKLVNGIDHPLTEPQPIYGGEVEPGDQSGKARAQSSHTIIVTDAAGRQVTICAKRDSKGKLVVLDHPCDDLNEPAGWITVTVIDGSGKRKRARVCGKIDSKGNLESLDHPCNDPTPIAVNEGDETGESTPPSKCLIYNGTKWVDCPPAEVPFPFSKQPPKCPNKLPALAVMILDPSFPDVWRGAYLCNAREIVPVPSSTKWRYVDQKRYGYQQWG